MNEELQKVIDLLPLIKEVSGKDIYMTVMDADGIVRGYSIPDTAVPQVEVGEKFVDPSGAFDEVMKTGKSKHNYLPKEVMGEAFEGVLAPIMDGPQVVGCLTSTYSVSVKEHMTELTEEFQSSIQAVNTSIQTMVDGIEKLFGMLTNMSGNTEHVETDVSSAVNVVSKISSNASRSNILALNASIEAARSGESGRGFAVVATEMGKLAKDSGESASEIKTTLDIINTELKSVISEIVSANVVAKEHLESANEIREVLNKTLELAVELQKNIQK